MKKYFLIFISLYFLSDQAFSQTTFTASQTGNWNVGTTWGGTCTSGCVAGTDYPASGDDVQIPNGVDVTVNGSYSCRNILINEDNENALTISNRGGRLTITGALLTEYYPPRTSLIASTGVIEFTGENFNDDLGLGLNNYCIAYWGPLAPLPRCEFNLVSNGYIGAIYSDDNFTTPSDLVFGSNVTISDNTLSTGIDIAGIQVSGSSATLSIASELNTTIDITQDGTTSSLVNNITVDGNLILGPNAYVNAATFNLNDGALLDVSFYGSNQTAGWWYQSNEPTNFNISESSTIKYSANANQVVYSGALGNLWLTGDAGITKTLQSGTNTLTILGDLDIDNVTFDMTSNTAARADFQGNIFNDGVWSPQKTIRFDGSSTQTIQGGNPINFQIVQVGQPGEVVSSDVVFDEAMVVNGTLNVYSSCTFTNNDVVTYNGNINCIGAMSSTASSSEIFSGTTVVSGDNTPQFGNVSIKGALTADVDLDVIGDFANEGTFDGGSNTVAFNGSTSQTISGSSTSSFYNLDISNSAGVSNEGNCELTGLLSLSGVFDADGSGSGSFIVSSTGLTTGGRIGALSNTNNFSGVVTVQRYIDGPDDWRYISVPIENATLASWIDDFPITGNFSDASPAGQDGVESASAPSVYEYDSSIPGWSVVSGGGAATSTVSLTNGKGYSVYTYLTSDFTIDVTGNIGKGAKSQSMASNAYNLIGNPYPSPIDWDNIVAHNSGINSSLSIRVANGQFATWNGSISANAPFDDWDGEIATGQSFWVLSSGGTSLSIQESDKTTNSAQFLRKSAPNNIIRIELSNGDQSDEAIVWLVDDATDTVDYQYDALKRKNGSYVSARSRYNYLNLSTYNEADASEYTINTLGYENECAKRVFLNVADVAVGTYTLNFSDINTLQVGYTLELVDLYTDKTTEISGDTEYSFDVTADVASWGKNRFVLQMSAIEVVAEADYEVANNCDDTYDVTILNSQEGVSYQVSNEDYTSDYIVGDGSSLTFKIAGDNLTEDSNLSITLSNQVCEELTLSDKLVEIDYEPIYEVQSVEDGVSCSTGESITLSAFGAPEGATYRWYESLEDENPLEENTDGELLTETLNASKTYYVAISNSIGCESVTRKSVEAKVVSLETPTIELQDNMLLAVGGDNYQWYQDGIIISGEEDDTLVVADAGDYYVEISEEGCTQQSDIVTYRVTGLTELGNSFELFMYPNPADDILNLKYNTAQLATDFSIKLYTNQGKEIQGDYFLDDNIDGSQQLDVSHLVAGLYYITVHNNGATYNFKVVKK